jgi:molybdenum cofactor cytidylyltransferase
MSIISAILLGAGESRRMGVDKLSLPWRRKTVLEHCFETLLQSEVQEIVVVLGNRNQRVKNRFQVGKTKVVVNPYSKRGMSTSIRKGLQAIRTSSAGILIALGDQPFLKTRTINTLVRAFDRRENGIIIPSFRGRMGHPVIFHKRYRKELLNLRGDVGGRTVVDRHPEEVKVVPVKSEGVVKDVDTWQDYVKEFRKKKVG